MDTYEISLRIKRHSHLRGAAADVLAAICANTCTNTNAVLAYTLGIHKDSVSRAISALADEEFISVDAGIELGNQRIVTPTVKSLSLYMMPDAAKLVLASWQPVPKKTKTRKAQEKVPVQGFVYLMLNNRSGYYKIGFSITPSYRERTLQAEDPDIDMIHHFAGTMADERALQQQYAAQRVRGEWFSLSPADVAAISAR